MNQMDIASGGFVSIPVESSVARCRVTLRAIQTMAGWIGQVIVDGSIVCEFAGCEDRDHAMKVAGDHVAEKLAALLRT